MFECIYACLYKSDECHDGNYLNTELKEEFFNFPAKYLAMSYIYQYLLISIESQKCSVIFTDTSFCINYLKLFFHLYMVFLIK